MISRQVDEATAALLPFQKPDVIRTHIDSLRIALEEIDTKVDITAIEKENEKRIEEMNARLERRRKKGFKKQAKRPAPKRARSL